MVMVHEIIVDLFFLCLASSSGKLLSVWIVFWKEGGDKHNELEPQWNMDTRIGHAWTHISKVFEQMSPPKQYLQVF